MTLKELRKQADRTFRLYQGKKAVVLAPVTSPAPKAKKPKKG